MSVCLAVQRVELVELVELAELAELAVSHFWETSFFFFIGR